MLYKTMAFIKITVSHPYGCFENIKKNISSKRKGEWEWKEGKTEDDCFFTYMKDPYKNKGAIHVSCDNLSRVIEFEISIAFTCIEDKNVLGFYIGMFIEMLISDMKRFHGKNLKIIID